MQVSKSGYSETRRRDTQNHCLVQMKQEGLVYTETATTNNLALVARWEYSEASANKAHQTGKIRIKPSNTSIKILKFIAVYRVRMCIYIYQTRSCDHTFNITILQHQPHQIFRIFVMDHTTPNHHPCEMSCM